MLQVRRSFSKCSDDKYGSEENELKRSTDDTEIPTHPAAAKEEKREVCESWNTRKQSYLL